MYKGGASLFLGYRCLSSFINTGLCGSLLWVGVLVPESFGYWKRWKIGIGLPLVYLVHFWSWQKTLMKCLPEEVSFVALNESIVLVKFGSVEDRSRILNMAPWLFDQFLLALLSFVKDKDLKDYAFHVTPFWTRIYNIPFEMMDRQIAMEVGEAIGEVMATDWRDRDGCWTKFLRLKIKIDISKPLRKGKNRFQYGNWLRVQLNGNGQTRGNWRNGMEIIESKEEANTESLRQMKARNQVGKILNSWALKRKRKLRVLEDQISFRFTGFYGHADPNHRNESWNMLQRVGGMVNETWIIGGDFNAIVNETAKEDSQGLVYAVSFPYIETKVVRQSISDHDAIILDTMRGKPKESCRDQRLNFKYGCWAKDTEAKDVIQCAWKNNNMDVITKIEKVGQDLCQW
ncbi:hypothetical protein GOBAR_AA25340 [Gossypium barbadense]|uniref:Uncharacterized protein n=1 Tax=Gossypium barbadense TaxID=3634 RepID=A0A2P5WW59_GOSBA|nr:hypothetical protein GOBAR_AA25340 [Gossypium barbadense]